MKAAANWAAFLLMSRLCGRHNFLCSKAKNTGAGSGSRGKEFRDPTFASGGRRSLVVQKNFPVMVEKSLEVHVYAGRNASFTVITAKGALVLDNLASFQQAWKGATNGSVIFDLSQVAYIDSSAIGSLVNAKNILAREQRRVAIAGAAGRVLRLFAMTHVETLFAMYPDVNAAEDALSRDSASSSGVGSV
jgi:anti-anti-sigma factor